MLQAGNTLDVDVRGLWAPKAIVLGGMKCWSVVWRRASHLVESVEPFRLPFSKSTPYNSAEDL
jgi:hypothetical protein